VAVTVRRQDGRTAERFGANLSRIRAREGLSQRSLAVRASLHRTEIDKLERGRRVPRIDTLVDLARAMAVPPAELIEGIEAGRPDSDPDPAGN
jgi:transcriptional regulator with XRE-family HTH domain